ncbi:MAG: pilus assembly protein PilM [Armatimonas sp.]
MSYQKIDDPAVDNDEGNPNMEVLLACAQRDMVFTHLETLKAAGLSPVAIDVEPLAVGRSLINMSSQGLKDKNVVVVNLGASMTDVGIFKQAILRFPRTIPLGGDNFTQAIADRLGLPMDAAEDEKKQNAKIFMDLVNQPEPDFGGFGTDMPEDAGISSPFDVDLAAPHRHPFTANLPLERELRKLGERIRLISPMTIRLTRLRKSLLRRLR